jgi:hypothetical protein
MGGMADLIWDRLETDGYDVRWCPGPQAPLFVCAGGRGQRCPLPCKSDAVVLDCWLDSDLERAGTPSWHLLRYYLELGLPVVALVGPDGLPGSPPEHGVVTLRRDASPEEISQAVRSVVREFATADSR